MILTLKNIILSEEYNITEWFLIYYFIWREIDLIVYNK